jgi:hypothetical protein
MKTSIHVFFCSEAECRWGRGVEYFDETAQESLEAAAGLCALDGRMTCPLASAARRAELAGSPEPAGSRRR